MTDFFKLLLFKLMLLITLPLSASVLAAPTIWHEPTTSMPFVSLAKGCFEMGTDKDAEINSSRPYHNTLAADEQPKHEVCLDAFWLGQFEVRASDWTKVMAQEPSFGKGNEPAGGIRFEAAQEFARRLTALSNGQYLFRLPTEAEWEYACRANRTEPELPYFDNRVDVAWYSVKNHRIMQPAEVGKLKDNGWGLYDMLGNVWEWVADDYQTGGYARHVLYNPQVKVAQSNERVIRGASHRSDYPQLRCANRSSYPVTESLGQLGLRLVRES